MKKILVCLSLMTGLLSFAPVPVSAVDCISDPFAKDCPCDVNPNAAFCDRDSGIGDQGSGFPRIMNTIMNVLMFAAGITALIMILVSAFRFVTANGSAERVTKARQALTYAIIGLVVAILSFAIVHFVIGNI